MSFYWALNALCVCVWVYLYVCVCVRSNHTTSKKPHYLSEHSKLIKCTHPPSSPPFLPGGGGLPWLPTKFSKGGGSLAGSQFLEGVTFFGGGRGGGILIIKSENLKYLTIKEIYKQKCFSFTIKNLNCEILTKK